MFQLLSSDVFYYLINQLPFNSILSLATCSSYFYKIISLNEEYWQLKCRRELHQNIPMEPENWRSIYMNSMNIFTSGNNYNGVLGFNYNIDKINAPTKIPGVKFKDISVAYHTLAIDLDDNVWSFGNNSNGQLGIGNKSIFRDWIPKQIKGIKAKYVANGFSSSAIIDLDDNIWTFGINHHGQLGLSDKENRYIPTQIPNIKCRQISTSGYHTVLIDMNYDIFICGSNKDGQLGLGDPNERISPTKIPNLKALQVSTGRSHTVVIDLENNVQVFGCNREYQLGLGDFHERNTPIKLAGIKVKQVSAGSKHTALIDMDDNLWTFGNNEFGQLGTLRRINAITPIKITCFGLKAKQISAGCSHTVVLDSNNNVWIFGGEILRISPLANIKAYKIAAGEESSAIITV